MNKGSRRVVYASAPLPSGGSWAAPIVVGDQLVGKFSLYDEGPDYELLCIATPTPAKSEAFKLPTVRAVAVVGEAPAAAPAVAAAPAADAAVAPIPASKRESELYAEHVRAAGVSYLGKLLAKCEPRAKDPAPIRADFEAALNELIAKHPKHLPALLLRLRFNVAQGLSVEAIVEQIVEAADTESLIKFFGQRHESENGEEKAGTDEKERRGAVREALAALVLWHAGEVTAVKPSDGAAAAVPFAVLSKEAVERVSAARQRLAAWTSLRGDKDREFLHAEVAHLVATGRAGTAAKLAEKHADGDDAAALLFRRCLVALGWHAWEDKLRVAFNHSRPKTTATTL
jgi:hypothetical protein